MAGYFYPANPQELRQMIDDFLSVGRLNSGVGEIHGLVVPHAGYVYSGKTAAEGYRLLRNTYYDGIILLGPCHRVGLELGSVLNEDQYETPLGKVPLNPDLAGQIQSLEPRLSYIPAAFDAEHSLEVHLPFIQSVFETVPPVLPILIGTHHFGGIQHIANVIFNVLDPQKKYLVLASSDLSHFHTQDHAEKLDHHSLLVIAKNSAEELGIELAAGTAEMCGFGPILVLEMLMKRWGILHSQIIDYTNSGHVTGDQDRVVGYGCVAFFKP